MRRSLFPSLNVRAVNALHRANIHTTAELHRYCKANPAMVKKLPGLGTKLSGDVCRACQKYFNARKGSCPCINRTADTPVILSGRYHYKSPITVLSGITSALLQQGRDTFLDDTDIDALRTQYFVVFKALPTEQMSKQYLLSLLTAAISITITDRATLNNPTSLLQSCVETYQSWLNQTGKELTALQKSFIQNDVDCPSDWRRLKWTPECCTIVNPQTSEIRHINFLE